MVNLEVTTQDPVSGGPVGRTTSRRVFLKRSLVLGLVLGSAGGLRFLLRSRTYTAGRRYKFLDPREAATMANIAVVMLPDSESFPTVEEIDLVGRIDEKLGHLSSSERKDLKALIFAFEYFAWLLGPAAGAFSSLSLKEKERYLEGWRLSRLGFKKTGFTALKQLTMLMYYTEESTWKAIGYKGTWVGKKGLGTP